MDTNLAERNPYACTDTSVLQEWVFLLQEKQRRESQFVDMEKQTREAFRDQIKLLKQRIKLLEECVEHEKGKVDIVADILADYRNAVNKATRFDARLN